MKPSSQIGFEPTNGKRWAVGEYNGNNAWLYNPDNGALYSHYAKCNSYQVRPLLASKRV